ncbi:T-box transcription factor tbx20 [Desmophyllum pertusum]|uniref:T-box transcription factor tbx20 n=1 Tax=Desmophyllum pertusum TaxID=174260 RepID=A0A9X0CDN6_9CNID|nr:T-box transcription factor tbx20 [Desmophyllum pertusum]
MSLKHLSSRKTANLSNKARAFSIASLVHKEELAAGHERDDKVPTKVLTLEREKYDTPVPRKKLKTLKPEVALEGKELWNCFYRLGTEMIITKTGRRMFPTVRVSFVDLDPDASYAVVLDIVPLDTKRHRYSYSDSAWFVAGEADAVPPKVTCVHPDSPFTAQQLQRQVLSFEKVKLTNNRDDKRGNIILNSMHKYQPRIHLIKNPEAQADTTDLSRAETFVFPETTFMAVTSYQNHLITRLKIYSNPFAKGFRDSIRFLGNTERESYLMSNGIQAYENGDGACFLSSGALTHGSQDLFSDEFYQVSTPAQWGPWEDLSCCRTNNNVTIANNCYPHSIQCAGSNDMYNRGHAWWRCPVSHTEDGVMINY